MSNSLLVTKLMNDSMVPPVILLAALWFEHMNIEETNDCFENQLFAKQEHILKNITEDVGKEGGRDGYRIGPTIGAYGKVGP